MSGTALVFVIAAVGTFVLTPLVRLVSNRIGAVVPPGERGVHLRPTATLGGVAMYFAFLAAMYAASRLGEFESVFAGSSEPLGVVLGATVILAVGVIDDLRPVSAPAKIAGMVLAGSILYNLGVTLFFFRVPFGDLIVLSADIAPLITVLWVVAMANGVNLIDGLDGLATGIVGIAAGGFYLYSEVLRDEGLIDGSNIGPLIALITAGVCVGFLPHNFHPARVFMGDGGALLLGLLVASSTMTVGGRVVDQFSGQTFFFLAPILIPFVIIGVPMLDVVFAIARRSIKRTSVAGADKDHLHHRLMRLGHGHRRTVVILWGFTAALCGIALYPTLTGEGDAWVPFAALALGLGLFTAFHPRLSQKREHPSQLPDEELPSETTRP